MFPFQGRLRAQKGSLEEGGDGSLSFHDCIVKASDVQELTDWVDNKAAVAQLQQLSLVQCKFDPRPNREETAAAAAKTEQIHPMQLQPLKKKQKWSWMGRLRTGKPSNILNPGKRPQPNEDLLIRDETPKSAAPQEVTDLKKQLNDFFSRPSTEGLRRVALHTPTLSNEDVASMLHGARDHLTELHFTWSFARAGAKNRHAVFQELHHLQSLTLSFAGLSYFGEMDFSVELAQAVEHSLVRLKRLGLKGWKLRDVALQRIVDSLRARSSFQALVLDQLAELTPDALRSLANVVEEEEGEELILRRCKSLFAGATDAEFRHFVERVTRSFRTFKVNGCMLTRPQLQQLLQSTTTLSSNQKRLASLTVGGSIAGQEERRPEIMRLFVDMLPLTQLLSLDVAIPPPLNDPPPLNEQDGEEEEQSRHRISDWQEPLVVALSKNTSLEEFGFWVYQYDDDDDDFMSRSLLLQPSRVAPILARNQRAHIVDRVVQAVASKNNNNLWMVGRGVARLVQRKEKDAATDVQRLLVQTVALWTTAS